MRRTEISQYSTVLWDLGGVLLHFDPAPRLAALSADCGLPEDEVHNRVWKDGLSHDWDRGAISNEEMYEAVRSTIDITMAYEPFLDVMLSAFNTNLELLPVIDAIRPELRQAAFSNNARHMLDTMPVRFPEVASRLEPLIFSCELKLSKPDPEAFEAALDVLGDEPEDVVFIDDSVENVATAAAMGFVAVRFESVRQVEMALRALDLVE